MTPLCIDIDDRMSSLATTLTNFLTNCPFHARFYLTPNIIGIGLLSHKTDEVHFSIDWLLPDKTIIADLKKLLDDRGWYPHLKEEQSITVNPDPDELLKTVDENPEDLEAAILELSTRKMINEWVIDRVTERGNQMLIRPLHDRQNLYVRFCKVPISRFLEDLSRIDDLFERWTFFASMTEDKYMIKEKD